MKTTLVAILLALACAGCGAPRISAEATAPAMRLVLERHDAYVKDDAALSEVERDVALNTTAALAEVWAAAGSPIQ